MKHFRLIAAAAVALQFAVPGAAQKKDDSQGEVQLRSDLVEVRAVVTDKKGRLRDDLRQEDFEVRENGKPREIAFFSVQRTADAAPPAAAPSPSPAAPAAGPAAPAAPAPVGRTVVLFVDAVNMRPGSVTRAKNAVRKFVDERLGERDLAAVVSSGGSLGLEGQFTRDRAVLRAAIDKIAPRATSFTSGAFTPYLASEIVRESNPEALSAGIYLIREEEGIPPEMDADVPGGSGASPRLALLARQRAREVLATAAEQRRLTLAALKAAVDRLARTPGQRLLALVSDGFTLFESGGDRDTAELKAVIARAVRSGVVIYSLSGEGLESGAFTGPDDPLYVVPPQVFPGYGTASRRDLEDGVTALAKDTGGEVFRNTNDLAGALGRMLDANGVYYAIAFYPEEGDVTKPRTIDVRLRNHADLSVRAQRGYELRPTDAAAAGAARPVVDALTAPAPPTAIPVVARADFAGSTADGALATLHVYVDGDRLEYRQEGEQRAFDLEVATAVFDESGASVDMKVESLAGKLAPRAFDLARANGFHVTRQAVLKPGRYQLRVAVRETATGRIGTSNAWVDVPDLGKGQLALGAVTLTGSHSAGGAVFVPRTPHGLRTFAVGDFLIYSLAAFNPAGESDTLMRIAILSGDRVVYRSAWEPIASRVTDRRDRTARISGQLQLGGTPPGAYTLRVEVQDPGRKQTVAQTAAFGVERP